MADDQNPAGAPAPPPVQAVPPFSPPPPISSTPAPGSAEIQARTWNMLCHLSALAGFIGIPFGNILGPLIFWQIKKNEFPSVDVHGKASLNFQITVTLAVLAGLVAGIPLTLLCIGWLLVLAVIAIGLAGLVFAIIAGIKANNGEHYQYPFSLRLIK